MQTHQLAGRSAECHTDLRQLLSSVLFHCPHPSPPFPLLGVQVDEAGIDMLLVGDSVAMVVHGHDTTLPVTMDEMLVHCKAVARGARRAFLVGDMPFGSGGCGAAGLVGGWGAGGHALRGMGRTRKWLVHAG